MRTGARQTEVSPELWCKITEILDAVEDLDTKDGEAWIAAAEAEDPELRDYLRTFLRAAQRLKSTQSRFSFASPLPLDELSVDLTGAQLGVYKLGRRIGSGGMGEVYLADRSDGELDRQVAVKVAKSGLDSRMEALFTSERDLLAKLEHPGIARLYDAGRTPEGLAYMVMEFVDGRQIDTYCDEHGLDLEARLQLMIKVCRAVHYAHQNLVLHRDIKPANILVSPAGDPKLLDFGISGRLNQETQDGTEASTPGVDAFTPGFSSPEQRKAGSDPIGVTSDVYSLGRVLEHLTADSEPTRGADVDDLRFVSARAVEKRPHERYGSAEQMAEDIERVLTHRPVIARPRSRFHSTRLFCRRNRKSVLSASVLTASLVAMGAVAAHQRDVAREAALRAEREKNTVLRLSDIRRLEDLRAQAENLWPIHPDQVETMSAWWDSATALRGRLDLHRDALSDIEARLAAEGLTADDSEILQWQRDILIRLTEDLSAWFQDEGLATRIGARRERAASLEARSVSGVHADTWSEAVAAVADIERFPHYRGLVLTPQIGLVPIGFDPHSRLLELAMIDTGKIPRRRPETGELEIEEEMAVVMVLLPSGRFWAGSQQDDPAGPNYDRFAGRGMTEPMDPISADVEPFFLAKYELTQNQWALLTGGSWPSEQNEEKYSGPKSWTSRLPVETVHWLDAALWLERHNLRLPTEVEWEYGARAGTDTPWWSGAEPESLHDVGNVSDRHLRDHGGNPEWSYSVELDDGEAMPAPIGTYRANPFGLHEIHGNVGEWCDGAPGVHPRYETKPERRAARGGSWWYTAQYAKVTYHLQGTETSALADIGIRAARSLTTD